MAEHINMLRILTFVSSKSSPNTRLNLLNDNLCESQVESMKPDAICVFVGPSIYFYLGETLFTAPSF
jgi:hypothetical protein